MIVFIRDIRPISSELNRNMLVQCIEMDSCATSGHPPMNNWSKSFSHSYLLDYLVRCSLWSGWSLTMFRSLLCLYLLLLGFRDLIPNFPWIQILHLFRHYYVTNIDWHICWNSKRWLLFIVFRSRKETSFFPFRENKQRFAVSAFRWQQTNRNCHFSDIYRVGQWIVD